MMAPALRVETFGRNPNRPRHDSPETVNTLHNSDRMKATHRLGERQFQKAPGSRGNFSVDYEQNPKASAPRATAANTQRRKHNKAKRKKHKQCSVYLLTGREAQDVEFIKNRKADKTYSGEEFTLITEYLQTLFGEIFQLHTNHYCANYQYPHPSGCLCSMHQYYLDAVEREWDALIEFWVKRKQVKTEEILIAHQILTDFHNQAKIRNFAPEDSVPRQDEADLCAEEWSILHLNTLYETDSNECDSISDPHDVWPPRPSCWDTDVEKVRKGIAEMHEQIGGKLFVPKGSKVRIPCGEDGIFADLEIGLDWKGNPMAVKYLKPSCPVSELAAAVSELQKIRHKNLLTCYISPGPNYVLVTPLMDYNLGQFVLHLNSTGKVDQAFRIARQMVEGIHALHTQPRSVVHGNLKPTNIFIDNTGTVKIAEYGLNLEAANTSPRVSYSTLIWKASEQIKEHFAGKSTAGSATSDVASLGMLLHFVLSGGKHPFGLHVPDIIFNIKEGAFEFCVPNPKARHLLVSMIAKEESTRPTMEEVVKHIFWWPEEEQWDFVEKCSEWKSRGGHELRAYISQQISSTAITSPDAAIAAPTGGNAEMTQDLLLWLKLSENIGESNEPCIASLQQNYPYLPFYIYKIVCSSPWAKSPLLHNFFTTISANSN